MSFDALTLSAVHDELAPILAESRIQKLVFLDELSLAMEVFSSGRGRTHVLLSADLEHARIQRLRELKLPARGVERDSPFSLLIRKHLRNARIRSTRQPRLERVFELECEQRDPPGRSYRVRLIVEAMGRRSNLVLVDEAGTILDAARRTPPSRNPRRPILPRIPYSPPPPQDRLLPEDVTAERLASGYNSGPLWKYLADQIAGLSPLAARELAFRALGGGPIEWERVSRVAREFMSVADTHGWEPSVAFDDDRPREYAPYLLTHLTGARIETFVSISEAMDVYYAHAGERPEPRRGDQLAAERKALLTPLERTTKATERRIAALAHQLELAGQERDSMRTAGETLLTHQAEIAEGAAQFDGIELDPQMTAVENAQAYFSRYRKAREAEERVPGLLADARNTSDHLAELRTLVEVADQMDAIRALRREVGSATGSSAKPTKATRKSAPYRRIALDNWEALVGTSAEGNNAVTFELAQPDDLWLHARGVPGAHVILRTNGATPPNGVIEEAAALAAAHSAARTSGAVEVDLTHRRYVKKIPGGPPGLVRYSNERSVRVTPRPG